MEVFVAVSLIAVIYKLTTFAKDVVHAIGGPNRATRARNVAIQGAVWVGAIIAVAVFAQSDFAAGVMVGDHALAALNGFSLLLLGLELGSDASALYDVGVKNRQSRDAADLF